MVDIPISSNYYPFGMVALGRSYSAGSDYRYGFDGYEKLNELLGNNFIYDFGARIYHTKIGKFLSVDSKSNEYSWQSPYAYFSNNPIRNIDFNGEGGGDSNPSLNTTISTTFSYNFGLNADSKFSFSFGAGLTQNYKGSGSSSVGVSINTIKDGFYPGVNNSIVFIILPYSFTYGRKLEPRPIKSYNAFTSPIAMSTSSYVLLGGTNIELGIGKNKYDFNVSRTSTVGFRSNDFQIQKYTNQRFSGVLSFVGLPITNDLYGTNSGINVSIVGENGGISYSHDEVAPDFDWYSGEGIHSGNNIGLSNFSYSYINNFGSNLNFSYSISGSRTSDLWLHSWWDSGFSGDLPLQRGVGISGGVSGGNSFSE